ncbi:MAG: hypothetical protein G8345_11205 [Magnetococcales bacterium]|nr:hypothetical protein [Magnetococcales bacterium]
MLILLKKLINQECLVLVESVENRVASGKSSGFLPVVCQEVEPTMVGHILSCQITGVDEERGIALARPLFRSQEAAI